MDPENGERSDSITDGEAESATATTLTGAL